MAVVYGGSLDHDFVFDDWHLVVGNAVVRWPLSDAPIVFEHRPGGVSYRPVRMISYMVDHAVAGGVEPWVFHASNVVYHSIATLLLYALAVQTIGVWGGAAFAAALWAVHPLGSEVVAYVSGRRDLLLAVFTFGGLLAWWRFCGTRDVLPRFALLVLTVLAAAMALGAKENAAMFPALAGLLFAVHARRGGGGGSPAVWAALGLGGLALWGVVDRFYLERVHEALDRLGQEPLAPQPALSLAVLGQYALVSVFPVELLADYREPAWPLPVAVLDARSLVSGVVIAVSIALGAVLLWRGRIAGAGLVWFTLALLPVAQIVPYREIVAEHNAYLPLAGLALAAGDAVASLLRRSVVPTATVCALLLVALGARAHARVADWADDETLWSVTLEHAPGSLRAKHNLASAHARKGRLRKARVLLEEAVVQEPNTPAVLETLATVAGRLGDDETALRVAGRAVEIEPTAHRIAFLGWVQLTTGSEEQARRTFQRALEVDRGNADATRGLEQIRARRQQRRRLRRGSVH